MWWFWIILGLVLFGLEVLAPGGFFMCFFGLGALLVGGLTVLGVAGPLWSEWLLFALFSIVLLLLFRRKLIQRSAGIPSQHDRDNAVGEIAIGKSEIAPLRVGQVDMRGSVWNARNIGTTHVTQGARLVVTKVDGLTLEVRREDER